MAGQFPRDNAEVTTATELLKQHSNESVKQHLVLDGQGRPFLVFTTYIGAIEGSPCTVDEYVYKDATSTQIIARQERTYKWKAAWDALFVFDPLVDYDADGDGNL